MAKPRKEFSVKVDLPEREEMTQIIRGLVKDAATAEEPLILVNRDALLVVVCMATMWLEDTK